jgi:hypothetical protein
VAAIVAPAEARRVALVIGNGAYQHTRALPNARNDARVIAALLAKIGFVVSEANDLAYRPMREAIRAFGQAAQGAEMALVYYAGHGLEVAGENWLLPVSAALRHEQDLEYEAVGLSSIVAAVKEAGRLRLVILDACRNNPLGERIALSSGTTRSVSRGLARVEPSGDILVAYSAKHGTLAEDGPAGGNSPFAAALASNLATPGLDVRIMLGKVRDDVRKATGGRQEPFTYGSVGGETIALLPGDAPAIAPALPRPVVVSPPPPQVAIAPPEAKPAVAVPTIEAPNEQLPADIPVSAEVLRLIETHPFFANAPPVRPAAYDVRWTSSDTIAGRPFTSVSNDSTTFHWLRHGLVQYDITQRGEQRHSKSLWSTSEIRTTGIAAANGFISLGYKGTSAIKTRLDKRYRKISSSSRLLRITNLNGQVFPLRVGNRLSFEQIWQEISAQGTDEHTQKHSCEVSKKFNANEFHADLTGVAYLVTCNVQNMYRKNPASNSTYQSGELFFEALGSWMSADPLSPRERLVNEHSDYTLKTFSVARP